MKQLSPRTANAVSILTEALMADPQVAWVFPDAADRRTGQELLYRSMAAQAERAGLIQSTEAGAAIWIELAEGESPYGPPEGESPSHPVLERNAERALLLVSALARRHPTATAHLYLGCIGVPPHRQGEGLGGALLRKGLAEAGNRPVYLEASSERSRRLYLRHGFADLGEPIRIADAPPLWPMWREPATPNPNS